MSTEFFQDIYVPKTMLFDDCELYVIEILPENLTDCHSIEAENVWVWRTQGSEFYFDAGETVRARVEMEKWNSANEPPAATENENADARVRGLVPYSIEASMNEPGLGGSSWW